MSMNKKRSSHQLFKRCPATKERFWKIEEDVLVPSPPASSTRHVVQLHYIWSGLQFDLAGKLFKIIFIVSPLDLTAGDK